MRSLRKNQRKFWYASYLEARPILDEWGNETLEVENTYEDPVAIELNISANVGQEVTKIFGDVSEYSRVISYVGSACPLKAKDRLWIGITTKQKANYEVKKVLDSLNSWLIGIVEVA